MFIPCMQESGANLGAKCYQFTQIINTMLGDRYEGVKNNLWVVNFLIA